MPRLSAPFTVAVALWTGLHGYASAADPHAETTVELNGRGFGSDLTLSFAGLSSAAAQHAGDKVQAEIERLETLLSTRRTDSELMRLNRHGSADPLSPELALLLRDCEAWRIKTGNAFSCRLGLIASLWEQAAGTEEVPDRSALRRSAMEISAADWDVGQTGARLQGMQLEPGALSQGWVVDRALARARSAAPDASAITIRLDGVSAHWSSQPLGEGSAKPWPVAITTQTAGGESHYGTVNLHAQAIAFSDPRQRQVDGRSFSYIIDPADGWPVEFAPSAVVVAPDAATANTLATALTTMPISRGIPMIDRLPGTEALIITETGKTFASQGWYPLIQDSDEYRKRWDQDWKFVVEYQIPRQPEAEYRRPYAAVWITDDDNELVRQLAVHGDNPRWLRDLSLWWRRFGRRDSAAIDGLAQATPVPGRHALVWDGRDERGRSVADGDYVLHIEAAREHGGKERIALPFQLSGQAIEQRAQGKAELGMVSVRFAMVAAGPDDRLAGPQRNMAGQDMAAIGSSSAAPH